ncbi:MAG: hypothetical protein ACOC8N_09460 [Spirochaetota bacterium]
MTFTLMMLIFLAVVFISGLFAIQLLKRARLRSSLERNEKSGARDRSIGLLKKLVSRYPHDTENRLKLIRLYMETGSTVKRCSTSTACSPSGRTTHRSTTRS